ncbi:MAG: hypothetical protein Q9160_002481 [Pyrenula sp. 1 TL-2023]
MDNPLPQDSMIMAPDPNLWPISDYATYDDLPTQNTDPSPSEFSQYHEPQTALEVDVESDTALDIRREVRASVSDKRHQLTSLQRRKAQNRIAQRLFRQKKDHMIKQLSAEVERLKSQSKNLEHTNSGLTNMTVELKATVSRLEKENQRLRTKRESSYQR